MTCNYCQGIISGEEQTKQPDSPVFCSTPCWTQHMEQQPLPATRRPYLVYKVSQIEKELATIRKRLATLEA